MAAQSLRRVRDKYIKSWSTHAYKMEYNGYLSNHLLHGVAALSDLGASDSQIDAFAHRYVQKLCVVEDRAREEEPSSVLIDDAKSLLGKRQNFEGLRSMYQAEIQHLSVDGAVTHHLPTLVGGLAGSLLHGIIQLGYAYHVGGDLLVAEGLAYLHFSYLSFEDPNDDQVLSQERMNLKALTREAAFERVRRLQEDNALLDVLHRRIQSPVYSGVALGELQRRLMAFSSDKTLGDPMLFSAVADAVDQFDFRAVTGKLALDFALWLYAVAPQNDFVLLHATTSAWSLHQVEHLLSVDGRIRAWKVWFRMALGAFIMHEVPELPSQDPCDLAEEKLAALPDWDELVRKTLALEGDVDEHVYKLVQVAQSVARGGCDATPEGVAIDRRSCAMTSFLTPTQREFVARTAALKVIREDFADLQVHRPPSS